MHNPFLTLAASLLIGPTLLQPVSAAATHTQAPAFSPALQHELAALERWSLVVKDLQTGQYWGYHPQDWGVGSIPASTYKIPHSLIGLDSGVITPATVFPWNGQTHELAGWNRDHHLQSAFQASCVPCYQQLARQIGLQGMQSYLQALRFGQMDVQADNLDTFWLSGSSRISPLEQVHFLERLALAQLPLKPETFEQIEQVMAEPEWPGLYGKTGWGREPHLGFGDSQPQQRHYGWYVGYARQGQKSYAFAARLVARSPVPDGFVAARKQVVSEALQMLGLKLKPQY